MNTKKLKFGSKAPSFKLPGVDGKSYSLLDFKEKKAIAIIFSCNHCPYVKAWEDRMVEIQSDYASKGFQLVAINSNETKNFPEDDFSHMIQRAKEKGFNFPYLRDDDQSVVNAYGASKTPEVFLFDQNLALRYHGAIDDNYQDPTKVQKKYLRKAIENILAGAKVETPDTLPVGCSVKWL